MSAYMKHLRIEPCNSCGLVDPSDTWEVRTSNHVSVGQFCLECGSKEVARLNVRWQKNEYNVNYPGSK